MVVTLSDYHCMSTSLKHRKSGNSTEQELRAGQDGVRRHRDQGVRPRRRHQADRQGQRGLPQREQPQVHHKVVKKTLNKNDSYPYSSYFLRFYVLTPKCVFCILYILDVTFCRNNEYHISYVLEGGEQISNFKRNFRVVQLDLTP